jgi:hypothetical protein
MSAAQPNAITNLIANVISVHEIDLSWTNNNPGLEAGAFIERSLPGQSTNFKSLATVAPGVTIYADTSVQPGGKYIYRVTALPFSSRAFVPAQPAVASAQTQGVSPHLKCPYPPHYLNGDFAASCSLVTDGSW